MKQDGVILLHGLARGGRSMQPLAKVFSAKGYLVENAAYPWRRYPIETLARIVLPEALERLRRRGATRLHFVTHSMGGIVLRFFLTVESVPEPGRVVMLSPPNQGSELIDCFGRYPWFRWLFGPAGCQLATGRDALPCQLGPFSRDLGIIAGNKPALGLFSPLFSGPNDGRVAVARMELAGCREFITVPFDHGFLMYHQLVQQQVLSFVEQGRFILAPVS